MFHKIKFYLNSIHFWRKIHILPENAAAPVVEIRKQIDWMNKEYYMLNQYISI